MYRRTAKPRLNRSNNEELEMKTCPKCQDTDLKQVQPLEKGHRYFICRGGRNGHLLRQHVYDVDLDYSEPGVIHYRFLVGNLELANMPGQNEGQVS